MVTPTFETFVSGVERPEPSLAASILAEAVAPDWSKPPEEFRGLAAPSTAASAKALSLSLALAEGRRYFLVVADGQVRTQYEMREPTELCAQGGRFVAIGGDFRKVANREKPPSLYHLQGVTSRTALAQQFMTPQVTPKNWEDIATELGGDADLTLAAGAPAPADGEPPAQIVSAQPHLPVPELVAALFLKPLPVRQTWPRGSYPPQTTSVWRRTPPLVSTRLAKL